MKVAKSPAPIPVRVAITPTLIAVDAGGCVEGELEGEVVCAAGPGLLPEQDARTAPMRNRAATTTPIDERPSGEGPGDERGVVCTGRDAPVAGSFTCIPLAVPNERALRRSD